MSQEANKGAQGSTVGKAWRERDGREGGEEVLGMKRKWSWRLAQRCSVLWGEGGRGRGGEGFISPAKGLFGPALTPIPKNFRGFT